MLTITVFESTNYQDSGYVDSYVEVGFVYIPDEMPAFSPACVPITRKDGFLEFAVVAHDGNGHTFSCLVKEYDDFDYQDDFFNPENYDGLDESLLSW